MFAGTLNPCLRLCTPLFSHVVRRGHSRAILWVQWSIMHLIIWYHF